MTVADLHVYVQLHLVEDAWRVGLAIFIILGAAGLARELFGGR